MRRLAAHPGGCRLVLYRINGDAGLCRPVAVFIDLPVIHDKWRTDYSTVTQRGFHQAPHRSSDPGGQLFDLYVAPLAEHQLLGNISLTHIRQLESPILSQQPASDVCHQLSLARDTALDS